MLKQVEVALPIGAEITEYRTRVSAVLRAAHALKIESPEDMEAAEELLKSITAGEKMLVLRKEEITRPLMKALASGRALFKPFENDFANAKKETKDKILAYHVEQEELIAAAQRKIEARVEKGTMRPDTAVAKLEKLDGAPRANVRVVRKLHIVDESMLPREYLVPNREAITKALFEGLSVPGAELIDEKIIASR